MSAEIKMQHSAWVDSLGFDVRLLGYKPSSITLAKLCDLSRLMLSLWVQKNHNSYLNQKLTMRIKCIYTYLVLSRVPGMQKDSIKVNFSFLKTDDLNDTMWNSTSFFFESICIK